MSTQASYFLPIDTPSFSFTERSDMPESQDVSAVSSETVARSITGTSDVAPIMRDVTTETGAQTSADPNPTGLLATFLASSTGQEGLSATLSGDSTGTPQQAIPLGVQASFADAPTTTDTTTGGGSITLVLLGVAIVAGAGYYYYKHEHKG